MEGLKAVNDGGVMMGGRSSDESDDENEGVVRRTTPYNIKTSGRYIFYSELKPARFARRLIYYLKSNDVAVDLDDKRWRLTFTVEGELDN